MNRINILSALLLSIFTSSCATMFTSPYTSAIPERPKNAPTGSEFIKKINKINEYERKWPS